MSSATRNIKSLGALRGFAVLPKSINTWRSSVLFAFSRYSKLRRKQSPNPTWYARRVSLEGFDLLVSLLTIAAEVEPFVVFLDRVRSRPLFVFDVSAIDVLPLCRLSVKKFKALPVLPRKPPPAVKFSTLRPQ